MKKLNAYIDVANESYDPVIFQKHWFQSVEVILRGIVGNKYNEIETVKHLIQIRDAFNIVSQNVNDKLPSEERVLLRNIFSTSIQVLNSAIKTKDFSKVTIVHSTIGVLVGEW